MLNSQKIMLIFLLAKHADSFRMTHRERDVVMAIIAGLAASMLSPYEGNDIPF